MAAIAGTAEIFRTAKKSVVLHRPPNVRPAAGQRLTVTRVVEVGQITRKELSFRRAFVFAADAKS